MKKTLSKIIMASVILLFPTMASAQVIRGGIKVMGNVESFSITATSTANATSTISKGLNVRQAFASSTETTTLWVVGLGTCTEALETNADGKVVCGTDATGAAAADLQDAYNNSGADAQITTADGKEFIYFISDTSAPADFIISAARQGDLLINVGSTTNAVWQAHGALGIGTTSPSVGFAVSATSTILGGRLHVDDHLRVGYIIATSTTNNTFGGALDVTEAATSTFTGGISASTGGLLTTTGLTITGGDIQSSGKLTITSAGTSTLPALNVSTALSVLGLTITGDLNVDTGTSTLQGATFAGLYTTNGLRVDTGDVVFDQKLVVDGAATSTFAGGITVSGATGGINTTDLQVTDQASFAGRLEVNGTATSSFAGGITSVGFTSTGGLRVDVGDVIFDQKLVVDGAGTSTFAGGLQVTGDISTAGILYAGSTATSSFDGSVDIDRNLNADRTITGGFASTTSYNVNCAVGNYQELIIDRDSAVGMFGCSAGQILSLGIFVGTGGDYQIDWDGPAASTSLWWSDAAASSTVGYLSQGRYNLCSFRFATTSSFAFASCALDFSPR